MTTEIAVAGLAILATGAFIRGLRFRRGADRSLLGLYRNANMPAVYRNIPLVLPLPTKGVLVSIAIAAVGYLRLLGEPSAQMDALLGIALIECLLGVFALTVALAFWSPAWLTPAWLREDDERVGYAPPKPGWADRLWLLIALGIVAIGLYFLAVVVWVLPAHGVE